MHPQILLPVLQEAAILQKRFGVAERQVADFLRHLLLDAAAQTEVAAIPGVQHAIAALLELAVGCMAGAGHLVDQGRRLAPDDALAEYISSALRTYAATHRLPNGTAFGGSPQSRLAELGVRVCRFEKGFPEWKAAGLTIEAVWTTAEHTPVLERESEHDEQTE